jgi:predicted amidohydrolase
MIIRVAGAQLPVINNDPALNASSIERAVDYAADQKADILLTPEGMLSGYDYGMGFSFAQIREALKDLALKAKSMNLGLAVGTIFEEDDGKRYNQLRFYGKNGEFIGFHSKILNCNPVDADEPLGELRYCASSPLRVFDFEGVTIGGLLCNDMWATPICTPMPDPHLSQQLSRMGAKIIFHGINGGRNSGPMSQNVFRSYHESNQRLRAMAGKLYIVSVDNAFPTDIPNSCASGVIDPDGEYLAKAPIAGEQFFAADIEIN